ncbi:MAG: hypothetical protein SynsKO_24130 [Synoicihabitans sp.]
MKKNILTIDDEEVILNLLSEFLTSSGYEVQRASTPTEARAVVARTTPDLIITDLQLEKSDGLELVASLRETLPDIPVILLTGVWFDEATVDENLSKKISAYHNKTAPLTELIRKIQLLLPA